MAIKVMSAAEASAKFAEVTPGRQRYYQANAPAAAEVWATNTAASGTAFMSGIQAAGIQQRYEGGVRRAGADKFRRKVTTVGVARYGTGVQAAQSDYQSGVAPYLETIAGLSLPRRATRGDPTNLQRVQQVSEALHRKRLALLGAG